MPLVYTLQDISPELPPTLTGVLDPVIYKKLVLQLKEKNSNGFALGLYRYCVLILILILISVFNNFK